MDHEETNDGAAEAVELVRDRATREVYSAGIHWYEAAWIGRKEFKIKRRLESQ